MDNLGMFMRYLMGNLIIGAILAVGFIGITCSHVITLAMAGFLSLLFLIGSFRKILENKEFFYRLLKLLQLHLCDSFFSAASFRTTD
jgi:hypothetical protein